MNRSSKKEEELELLISDCLSGKPKAQYTLFKTYYGMMMNVCLRYARHRDEAKDMLNEGFIKIFGNLSQYSRTGPFEGWIKRVMANAALDYQRKYEDFSKMVAYDEIEENRPEMSYSNMAPERLTYDELMNAIQQLPTMSKNVFNLYIFENYSHAEIAEILGIKEGTSHWHLNFARKKLKERIALMNHVPAEVK